MSHENLMTVTEAADALKISRTALYHAINNGRLKSFTVLGRRVLERQDVEAYHPRAFTGKRDKEPDSSPHYDPALTSRERAELLMAWAESHERADQPLLSDEALTRETMYGGTGADRP